jgi:hypothetical protein
MLPTEPIIPGRIPDPGRMPKTVWLVLVPAESAAVPSQVPVMPAPEAPEVDWAAVAVGAAGEDDGAWEHAVRANTTVKAKL